MHQSNGTPAGRRTQRSLARRATRALTLGSLVAALAAAAAWSLLLRAPAALHATSTPRSAPMDNDGDGLADALELRLGLSPVLEDTDSDGYADPEELARHSSPLDPTSVPGSSTLSVGLVVYMEGGLVRPVSVIYTPNGGLAGKSLGMGARVGVSVRSAPVTFFMNPGSNTTVLGGYKVGSSVTVMDATLDPLLVTRFGSLSLYTTVASGGVVVAADVIELLDKDGVLAEYLILTTPAPLQTGQGGGAFQQGVFSPLDGSSAPPEWNPGEICSQQLAVVGTLGPVILQEVVSAECEDGWDAYCDPACPATVGSTIELLDPAALIGG